MMVVLKRRVIDRNVLRLIGKWLSAGVVEKDGHRIRTKQGTPQGGVISPLLANIFLHYVVDVFVHEWRKTARKRFTRSMKSIAEWCSRNRHLSISWQWKQLRLKLTGHYNYYGVRGNFEALARFRYEVWKLWLNALKRRSQKVNKDRLYKIITSVFVLPTPKITHPEGWLDLNPGYLLGRAGCGNSARPVL